MRGGSMEKLLTKWVLKRVNGRQSPKSFVVASSGRDVDAQNWFILRFTASPIERYVFRDIDQVGYKFGQFNGDKLQGEVYLGLKKIESMEMRCEFFFQGYLITYTSKRIMFVSQTFLTWWFSIKLDKVAQWLFNRRSLATADRIEMMRFLCGASMENPDFQANVRSRPTAVHGKRFWRHPDAVEHAHRERFLLDSLVDTGDLQDAQNGNYRVLPRMLASLEAIEGEDRRHRRSNRIQWLLFLVALCAAAGTVIQAYEAWQQAHPAAMHRK